MNYLSHGYRFLDRPLFLAGTAIPDWLSVVNRRIRVRSRRVHPVIRNTTSDTVREIGQGILQHHKDDDSFHRSEVFMRLEGDLAEKFRRHMPDKFDHRPGFLGHIVVELLLDDTLVAADPTLLDRYYETIQQVDAQDVEDTVNLIARDQTDQLAWFIGRFLEEKFLYDYRSDDTLLTRLNQVLRRVKLTPMSTENLEVLSYARSLLRAHSGELLQAVEQA